MVIPPVPFCTSSMLAAFLKKVSQTILAATRSPSLACSTTTDTTLCRSFRISFSDLSTNLSRRMVEAFLLPSGRPRLGKAGRSSDPKLSGFSVISMSSVDIAI